MSEARKLAARAPDQYGRRRRKNLAAHLAPRFGLSERRVYDLLQKLRV